MVDSSEECSSLADVRANIDRLDRQIVALLAERGSYVKEAARFKKSGDDVKAPARAEQVIGRATGLARELGADPRVVERVYRTMIAAFIEAELGQHRSLNPEQGAMETGVDRFRVEMARLNWQAPAPGVRYKAVAGAGQALRLIELTSEFVEEDWCLKGHLGLLLQGELEVTSPQGSERFAAGDGIFIQESQRHKARVLSPVARLVLVERS